MYEADGDFFKISEIESEYYNLREKLLQFAVNSLKFLKTLPKSSEYEVLKHQFSKSSTYKEFLSKVRIALREANESKYWLKIMEELKAGDENKRNKLVNEIITISKIQGSITAKVDKKLRTNKHV